METTKRTPLERDIALIRRRVDSFARIKPPQDSYVQDFLDTTFVPAGAVTTWIPARTIEIPAQKRAVVKYFAMEGDRPAAVFMTRFRFVTNGAGGVNYQAPPVTFSSISQPSEIWIDVDQQNLVQLQFKNLDQTIGYNITTRVICWSWDINVFLGNRGL